MAEPTAEQAEEARALAWCAEQRATVEFRGRRIGTPPTQEGGVHVTVPRSGREPLHAEGETFLLAIDRARAQIDAAAKTLVEDFAKEKHYTAAEAVRRVLDERNPDAIAGPMRLDVALRLIGAIFPMRHVESGAEATCAEHQEIEREPWGTIVNVMRRSGGARHSRPLLRIYIPHTRDVFVEMEHAFPLHPRLAAEVPPVRLTPGQWEELTFLAGAPRRASQGTAAMRRARNTLIRMRPPLAIFREDGCEITPAGRVRHAIGEKAGRAVPAHREPKR